MTEYNHPVPEKKTIERAERLIEYGKLYLQRKAEGVNIHEMDPMERRNIFRYLLAFRMYEVNGEKEADFVKMTDEEFIADREKRLKGLRDGTTKT